MDLFMLAGLTIAAYLLGSIPTAVWIGKIFYGLDIREHGSGNAGTTNTFRILGAKAGIPVFIVDVLKAFVATSLVLILKSLVPGTRDFINAQLLLGAAAVIGHIFPVYVGFKGGKGVASLLGVVLAIVPEAGLIAAGIFTVTLLVFRYVSLSSLIAGVSFPILVIVVFQTTVTSLMLFSVVIAILLLLTHQKNIERLIRKEENKAKLFKRGSKPAEEPEE
jgi:acyl phosphate:glycerol-3-phosphate acyltransferase